MYFKRDIEDKITKNLFKGQIIIIYGARRVGKTTLVKALIDQHKTITSKYINCDEPDIQRAFAASETSLALKDLIGQSTLIIIDEAQRIHNIGIKLKLLIDTYPDIQIVATGSSSFDLANEITEPLTGRAVEFWLYPLSLKELAFENKLTADRYLESLLIFGSYPKVFSENEQESKIQTIKGIADNYLYKDILKFQSLKNSEVVQKLLEALALQVGQEVSYGELSKLVGVSKDTIKSYIELLEKVFVIFRLPPFSRNLRKELGKLRKIYFYDLGIRNALIRNMNPLSLRADVGRLWENFVIAEKKKHENTIGSLTNFYFWRTYDGAEIDLIEDSGGSLHAYEIKWQKFPKRPPKAWSDTYPKASWEVINKNNYYNALLLE